MKTEGSISLLIRGNEFNVKEFDEKMSICDSVALEKGEISDGHKMTFNLWEYQVEYNEDDINEILKSFCETIKPKLDIISQIQTDNNCILQMFIQSEEAQMGLSISSENLLKIADLGIRFEISILSYGLVFDEDGSEHNINEIFGGE